MSRARTHAGSLAPWRDPIWRIVARRALVESRADRITLLAAGVAFYAFLALVPALIATVSVYGLVADPAQLTAEVRDATAGLPEEARDLITAQLKGVTQSSDRGLGLGVALGVAIALSTASAGVRNLLGAVGIAYETAETRGFLRVRAVSILLTLAAILFYGAAFVIVAVIPGTLDDLGVGFAGRTVAFVFRYGLLGAGLLLGLAAVYRFGPDHAPAERPPWSTRRQLLSPGAIVATALWLIASGLFSLFVANFGSYNETYGSLGAIVVLLLWLWISGLVVILGAEVNCETERARLAAADARPRP